MNVSLTLDERKKYGTHIHNAKIFRHISLYSIALSGNIQYTPILSAIIMAADTVYVIIIYLGKMSLFFNISTRQNMCRQRLMLLLTNSPVSNILYAPLSF